MKSEGLKELRERYLNLQIQASFPDSGHFYSQKQRELDVLFKKLESEIPPDEWNKFCDDLFEEGDKQSNEYYDTVVFIDKEGKVR